LERGLATVGSSELELDCAGMGGTIKEATVTPRSKGERNRARENGDAIIKPPLAKLLQVAG
jgi:hypothetical protein